MRPASSFDFESSVILRRFYDSKSGFVLDTKSSSGGNDNQTYHVGGISITSELFAKKFVEHASPVYLDFEMLRIPFHSGKLRVIDLPKKKDVMCWLNDTV